MCCGAHHGEPAPQRNFLNQFEQVKDQVRALSVELGCFNGKFVEFAVTRNDRGNDFVKLEEGFRSEFSPS